MADGETLKQLERLAANSEHTGVALSAIQSELQMIRNGRLKPYIASMGSFLALFVSAVGYVYAMEQRLTGGFFDVQASIHELRSFERINEDRIQVLDARLKARTASMNHRWDAHMNQHKQIDDSRKMMAQEILLLGRNAVDN